MENFCKFVRNMDENVKGLLAVAYDNRKKHIGRKYFFLFIIHLYFLADMHKLQVFTIIIAAFFSFYSI